MTPPSDRAMRAARAATLLIWLACAAALCILGRAAIAAFSFRDPDDILRLLEVRDWLAGQSWFDVTQYRIFPPEGVHMHWSRLVDLPLAAALKLSGLFASQPVAERITLVAVPLLCLLGLFATLHAMTMRLTGRPVMAVIGSLMLAVSMGITIQFLPMRIDHHGWQILLGSLAMLFALRALDRGWSQAMIAGLLMAASLTIAIEGLPVAVAMAGGLALLFLLGRRSIGLLLAFLASLTLGCATLLLATRGWSASAILWCDALSPAYLAPMAAATAALLLASRLIRGGNIRPRLVMLGLAGAASALAFASTAPQCLAGPFSQLDPLVYRYWYRAIGEGMPVWTQPFDVALVVPLQGLIGLIGSALALRAAPADRRDAWLLLLIVQIAAFGASLTVVRAMGTAHALAIPGAAWLVISAMERALRARTPVLRVILGFSCFALTPLGAQTIAYAALVPDKPDASKARPGAECASAERLRGLGALAPALVFTPFDIGPNLLIYTHHRIVASSHHRNAAGMKSVISGFIAPPESARAIVQGSRADYIAFCADQREVGNFLRHNRGGLLAALVAGRTPAWLQPVPMPAGETIRVYRILRSAR